MSRSLTVDFNFISLSSFHFIFLFSFFFYFSIFRTTWVWGLSVTLSHHSQIDGEVTRLITRHRRRRKKVLEQSDVI